MWEVVREFHVNIDIEDWEKKVWDQRVWLQNDSDYEILRHINSYNEPRYVVHLKSLPRPRCTDDVGNHVVIGAICQIFGLHNYYKIKEQYPDITNDIEEIFYEHETSIPYEELGELVKKERLNKRITLRNMINLTGVEPSVYSEMERGINKTKERYDRLVQIAKGLGIKPFTKEKLNE
jgi:hypothetical protein